MANVKQYKIDNVNVIKSRLDGARAIVLVDYKGINVEEVSKLRNNLRKEGVDYFVAKNTWLKIALNDLNIKELDPFLFNSTAIAVSKTDEVAPARIIKKFMETELEKKEINGFKAGLIEGNLFTKDQLFMLANLPSKEELIAKVLYGLNSPITGLVGVMSGIIRKFALVVDAIRVKKAE
jgi:large subunit ribosomal protein L10